MIKKILLVLFAVLVIIQFFRPAKNLSGTTSANDIVAHLSVPKDVQNILYKGCYDCHSNNTRYPWYAEVQPVAWWLNSHIKDGQRGLNFNEFASYRLRRQYKKLQDVIDEVKGKDMPLSSYTFIHKDADLTDAERAVVVNWASAARDHMKAIYPADSLVMPKK